jgi:hypothetical protein
VRTLVMLIAGAALGLGAWLAVGSPFAGGPVTKAEIERAVAKRPDGQVQLVLCDEQFVPSSAPAADRPQTWTCDTYLGPSKADAQNGPSYQVTVSDDRIASIRQVASR